MSELSKPHLNIKIRALRLVLSGCLVVSIAGVIGTGTAVRAAGSSYSGGTVAGPGGVSLPITRVVTITPQGKDVAINTQYGTLSIQVPPHSFSGNVQLVAANASAAYSAPSSTREVSVSFLIAVYKNGVKVKGRFLHPLTVEMAIPFIHQGDQIYVKSTGAWQRTSSAVVRDGYLRIEIWSDPVIAVLSAKSTVRPIILPGDHSTTVARLQKFLNGYGYRLSQDGVYGPMTLSATKHFQRAHNLKQNGIVGPRTWAILARTAPAPYPTISLGSKSPEVSTLKKLLASQGFHVAKQGGFDRALLRAVNTFQARNHLRVTGVVTRSFWNRLGVM